MSLSVVYTRGLSGILSPQVQVEVHVSNGLPSLTIVGLADTEVKESKDRVRAAILNSGFEFPPKKITINLAPADLPKESGRFDLAIAIGILIATGQIICEDIQNYELVGELSLSGELRSVRGALAMGFALYEYNKKNKLNRKFILPLQNAGEASFIEEINIIPISDLKTACKFLENKVSISPFKCTIEDIYQNYNDLQEVKGQYQAKRALEIAAAGNHSILMVGCPGTGKSMLASRFTSILPEMTQKEALESATVLSLLNNFSVKEWKKRPYRSPHHTASAAAMVGGSSNPKPGEISLAHNGVLFLDELPEFDRKVLEVLREPLETGEINISRAGKQANFPARFQLIAAMNPCPCGYLGHKTKNCRCTPEQVKRYQGKLSGPFLDRIDLQIEVPALTHDELLNKQDEKSENSIDISKRVKLAREIQIQRQGKTNAQLNGSEIDLYCKLDISAVNLLKSVMQKLGWSARACHRALKVARTIADLENSPQVLQKHIAESIQYRRGLISD